MADLSADEFTESAREFAVSALDAHVAENFRRVALDAGTALEHLAKACLAARSPVLLTELRGEGNFSSLLVLLGIAGPSAGRGQLRTVGLRDALARVGKFVSSQAALQDIATLVDMRDGTVHAAQNAEVEDTVVEAFVRHADAMLADLKANRTQFWGRQVTVVDALLAEASDKTARRVAVKLAAAHARLASRSAGEPAEHLELDRRLASARSVFEWDTAPGLCPVCDSWGIATGVREVAYDYEGDVSNGPGEERTRFHSQAFRCTVCGLRLDSPAEMTEAEMDTESEEW